MEFSFTDQENGDRILLLLDSTDYISLNASDKEKIQMTVESFLALISGTVLAEGRDKEESIDDLQKALSIVATRQLARIHRDLPADIFDDPDK